MHLQQSKAQSRKTGGQQYWPQARRFWQRRHRWETVLCAAVRLTDGAVYTGLFHGDALRKARKAHAGKSESCFRKLFEKSQDGFVTNNRRFINRREAYKIAVSDKQITPNSYCRAYADLWGSAAEADDQLGAVAFNNVRTTKAIKKMNTKETADEAKTKTWRLFEKILGPLAQVVNHRPDWKVHHETDTSVLVTFSKSEQLFYDVSETDLEQFGHYHRSFIVFIAGSSKEVFVVPSGELREHIESSGLTPSQEYGDFKLHLMRDYRGTYFREVPLLNLAIYFNQYAQLL